MMPSRARNSTPLLYGSRVLLGAAGGGNQWSAAAMRWIATLLAVICGAGPALAQQQTVGEARECTRPGEIGCEQPLVVTGGQCHEIARGADPAWGRADIDRMTNACFTCDDLDRDFRFGDRLGFFRCQPRVTATPAGPVPSRVPSAPAPAWQQRQCTRYALQRESETSVALTVQNRCDHEIVVNACATWRGGAERAPATGQAAPGQSVVVRWPVDVYTRANVVWNFCPPGEDCPAPCP
jgi:hypothetical protein